MTLFKMETNFICLIVFLFCFPKPVAANSGITWGTVSAIVICVVCIWVCYCYCCKRRSSNSKSGSGGSSGAIIVREEPQITVIASQERHYVVQTADGLGVIHERIVADSDGNVAARQSLYAVS